MTTKSASFILLLLLQITFIVGCGISFQEIEYKKAKKNLKVKKYSMAVKHFSRVIKQSPSSDMALDSARSAARVSMYNTEKFIDAISFYKHLVLYSPIEKERVISQKKIATLYFDKLTDYKNSILEFNKLLNIPHNLSEEIKYKMAIARSYYYLNNFFQSQVEVEELLKKRMGHSERFEVEFFRANIFLTTKKYKKAAEIFLGLVEKYPKRSKDEKIGMSIASCYEEMEEFDKSIEHLKKLKNTYPSPEFIELKINRLKERQKNLPGYKGFRK